MSMYSSIEGTSNLPTVNGLPNAGQYGWTAYEIENYEQLSNYVDQCKQYFDQIVANTSLIQTLYDSVFAMKNEIDNIIIEIRETDANISAMQSTIKGWYDQVGIWEQSVSAMQQDVTTNTQAVTDMLAQVTQLKLDVTTMKAAIAISERNASDSAAAARTSEVGSKNWFDRSYDLYLELQKGQVYRGTWNPNTQAYPDPQGTNSFWDVILNPNQPEVDFDGKKWYFGDRLVYVLASQKFEQLEAGEGNVKSVNGKVGAVIINAADVGAVSKTGDTMSGDLTLQEDLILANSKRIRVASSTGVVGDVLTLTQYDTLELGSSHYTIRLFSDANPQFNVGGTKYDFYTPLNKPTPADLGMYTSQEVNDLIDQHLLGYYNKTETDNKLALKADVTVTNALSSTKVDKTTTINNKPLTDDVVLTPADVGALALTGGTLTGDLFINPGSVVIDKSNYPGVILKNRTAPDDTNSFHMETEGSGVLNFVYRNSTTGVNKAVIKLNNASSGFIYHTGNRPSAVDVGAADVVTSGSTIEVLSKTNPDRVKEVKFYAKDNNLFTVGQDGTVAKFYNDRSYRPTAEDFGGLFVADGNAVNFPMGANQDTLYFNYSTKGASTVSKIRFHNGKSQAAGLADVFASTFHATNGQVVYNGTSSNDSTLLTYVENIPTIRYGGSGVGANKGFQILGPGNNLKMKVTDNGEIVTKYANGYRITYGDYGTFWRNDGASLYLMKTAKGDPNGSYDSSRPLRLNLENGDMSIHQVSFPQSGGWKSQSIPLNGSINFDAPGYTVSALYNLYNTKTGSVSSPPMDYGTMQVIGNTGGGGFVTQIAHARDRSGTFIRHRNDNGNWTPWLRQYQTGKGITIPAGEYPDGAPEGTNGFKTSILLEGTGAIQQKAGRCGMGFHENGSIYAWNNKDGQTTTYSMDMSRDNVRFSGTVQASAYKRADGSYLVAPDGNINLLNPPAGLGFVNGYFLQQVMNRGNWNNYNRMFQLNDNYQVSGGTEALIRGRVQSGAWSAWRDRAAGINVDNQDSYNGVSNVWKLTHWSKYHIASMAGYVPGGDLNNAIMKLTVHNNGFDFTANGNFTIAGSGYGRAWNTGSDIKLKKDIRPIESALSFVDKIDTIHYKLKSDESENIGFIAQNLQNLIPEVVSVAKISEDKEDSYLSVNYGAMSAYNTACIKELKVIVENQNSQIEELKQLIKELLNK